MDDLNEITPCPLTPQRIFEIASPYFRWNADSWREATLGTIGMPFLLEFTKEAIAAASPPVPQAAPSGKEVIDMLRRALDQAGIDGGQARGALVGYFANEWNKSLAAAPAAPVIAQAAPGEPVLWIDAEAEPHQKHGSLYPDDNTQIALLGCTKGPFGSFTTPLYAAPVAAQQAGASDALPGHRDVFYLLANCRRLLTTAMSNRTANWLLARELFATGSTSAHDICREAGIDPDGTTVSKVSTQKDEAGHG